MILRRGSSLRFYPSFPSFFYRISWHKFCMGFHCGSFFFCKNLHSYLFNRCYRVQLNLILSFLLPQFAISGAALERASVRSRGGAVFLAWAWRPGVLQAGVPSLPSSSSNPPPLSHTASWRGTGATPPSWLPPSMSLACLTGGCVAARGVRFSSEDAAARRSLLRGRCGPTACGLPVVDPAARRPFQQWRR
jgi:hypothetical protein